jgi:hypothetical protein
MLWNNVFLFALVANIVADVGKQIDEGVGDEADQVHRFFLGSNVLRKRFLDDFVKSS